MKKITKQIKASGIMLACLCASQTMGYAKETPVFYMEPVIVTANRTLQTLTEAKADVSVITRKEIEKNHITNPEQALRRLPGIQFLNYGYNGRNANVSRLRLNGSANIVVLVDGVKVNDFRGDGENGSFFASQINGMDNIEQIDVLRGAAGMQYGSGAQGGVINIITREITDNKTSLDFSGGEFGKKKMSIYNQGKNGKTGYSVYYVKNKTGDMVDGDGQTVKGNNTVRSYGMKMQYDFSKSHNISIAYDDFYTHYDGYDPIYTTPYMGHFRKESMTFKHAARFKDRWKHRFTYRHNKETNHYVQTASTGDFVPPWSYTYDIFNEQLSYVSDKHTFVFGIDYNKGKDNLLTKVRVFDGKKVLYEKNVHRKMENFSIFAQEDWRITDEWLLSLGVRHDRPYGDDYVEKMEPYTSYSYKIGYDFTPKDSIYASYNDFYIFPSMAQKFNPRFGNAHLEPGYGHTNSFGYNRKFSNNHILMFNWFRTKSEKYIGYVPAGSDYWDGKYENISNALSRGWNLQWQNQWNDHWASRLGFSHIYIYAEGDTITRGYYPKNMLTFAVNYSNKKWNLGLDGFYFDRYINPEEPNEGGWPERKFSVWNINATYEANKNTAVYINVDNIFNKLWAEHTHVIWGGGPRAWYSQPGRCISFGVKYTF